MVAVGSATRCGEIGVREPALAVGVLGNDGVFERDREAAFAIDGNKGVRRVILRVDSRAKPCTCIFAAGLSERPVLRCVAVLVDGPFWCAMRLAWQWESIFLR